MKIAYLVSQFPETFETFILREIAELSVREIQVEVFSLKVCRDKIVHEEAKNLADKVHYRPFVFSFAVFGATLAFLLSHPLRWLHALWVALSADFNLRSLNHTGIRIAKNLAVFPKSCSFAWAIRSGGFRHLHAHWANTPTTAAMMISILTRVPFSITAHAFDIYKDRPRLGPKLRTARFVVTCTDYNREYLQALAPNKSDKIYLNYHGLDPELFCHTAPRLADPLRLLAVGRLTQTKGFFDLVEACAQLMKAGVAFECTLVGDGELRRELEAAVVKHKMSQVFQIKGVIGQKPLRILYETADIFVMPSVVAADGDRDGIPNVVLEAMAAGLPIVATQISGLPEAVEDGRNGLLVPERSASRLAEAIQILARDSDRRDQMGKASRARVMEQFVLETNISELVDIFEKETVA